ncbi:hypothetical protein DET65_3878 [Sunxiuqinia elliptica]|uniref:Uncharacterized protein n=1 Tax=Sunxiuqinia elliptica TaxID=655355 RepID=A0A4R6GUH6_9BACT|nr:hypothetical protein DET52_10714 [Sunxiuqinia elliptica]TDO56328.1 hypothetical protein DET65_3878 [Sunxiuqinia elliptica]
MGESIELVEGPSWLGDSKIKGFKISIVPRWRKSVICALSIKSNNFLILSARHGLQNHASKRLTNSGRQQ